MLRPLYICYCFGFGPWAAVFLFVFPYTGGGEDASLLLGNLTGSEGCTSNRNGGNNLEDAPRRGYRHCRIATGQDDAIVGDNEDHRGTAAFELMGDYKCGGHRHHPRD